MKKHHSVSIPAPMAERACRKPQRQYGARTAGQRTLPNSIPIPGKTG